MKRLKFKKPFNGMDNAKKLIPESYKVDGNEFEITDGNETYRVKWSSLINEGIILTSSNKGQINEDMNKIKHLMGFKSQDTLGTVKGADRLDENKKFGDVLDKTKNLLNEEANENLELKSLAKKFIPIIKKYKMGVEYKTDTKSIEAKPDNVNQTPPAKLIVHNDGILTVAVYFLSLSRSLNELDYEGGPSEQDYEKAKSQAGNMYKELIAVIPEGEFDLRSRPEPNKYGWYIMQFKKKGGDKDIKPGKSVSENEHIKSGMVGSNKGKSRTDKTEVLKKNSKKGRRKADKEATKDINEDDVANFQDALSSNPKVVNAAKKLNTPIEKIEAADEFINNIAGDDDALIGKIIRAIKKDDSDVVNELENSELADLNKDGELSSYEEKRGSAIEKAMEAPVDETAGMGGVKTEQKISEADEVNIEQFWENLSIINQYASDMSNLSKEGINNLISSFGYTWANASMESAKEEITSVYKLISDKERIQTPPSEEEEQAAQVYEDRFDEVFEGMYEDVYESEETMSSASSGFDDDMNRPPNAGRVQTYNNNIISKISSESGLTDFVFSPTVNIHGKGSLYIFAEKGDDFIEIDNIGIYADIGNYGEVDNVTYKVDYNNPDIKRLLTSFISPEQLNNLFDDAEIEVEPGEEEGEEYDSDFSI